MAEHFERKLLEKILSSEEMLETAEDIADVLGRREELVYYPLRERLLAKGVLEIDVPQDDSYLHKIILADGCTYGFSLEPQQKKHDHRLCVFIWCDHKKANKKGWYNSLKDMVDSSEFSGWFSFSEVRVEYDGVFAYINKDKLTGSFDSMADELIGLLAKIEKEVRKILEE